MLKNLKLLRTEAGISQQQLAEAVNLSQPSINKYENHNIEPDIETLKRMADYFDTSIDYIVGHTELRRKIEVVKECALNEHEAQIIRCFRRLSKEQRKCIESLIYSIKPK